MGMFDSIYFKCPVCENSIEHQSKSGDCILSLFSQFEVPANIAIDIEGEDIYCEKCSTHSKIEIDQDIPKTVKMKLKLQ